LLIGDLGEEALLRQLRGIFNESAPDVLTGIGDDAAVIDIPPGSQGVWSTDLLLQGVHFESAWQTPRQLGAKSIAVNLSDLAAMGATPRFAMLSLALPPDIPVDYILEFCQGLAGEAVGAGVVVIGGDTTRSKSGLVVSVTAGGHIPAGGAVLRSGARLGDVILVTGQLGSAAAGLLAFENGVAERYPALVQAFIAPRARSSAGTAARESGATAMTDLSDGLASDLRHICEESCAGARIELERIPFLPQLETAADECGWDREKLMLTGGEDYELLLTVPGESAGRLREEIDRVAAVPTTVIGEIMPPEYGIRLIDKSGAEKPMPEHGFDHFAP